MKTTAIILFCLLALLYHRSFEPGEVLFSNDLPLGAVKADWIQLPSGFFGSWDDLNSIGFSGGQMVPGISSILRWVLGPVGYSKFYIPIALFILGMCTWTFLTCLKLSPTTATLGAVAMTLNSTFFSAASWGIGSHGLGVGMCELAMASIVSNGEKTPFKIKWTRLALAGLAVGVNVIEAADVGALLSIFVFLFLMWHKVVYWSYSPSGWLIRRLFHYTKTTSATSHWEV
jgi:hypothetical protein